jgi:hypothetical protein
MIAGYWQQSDSTSTSTADCDLGEVRVYINPHLPQEVTPTKDEPPPPLPPPPQPRWPAVVVQRRPQRSRTPLGRRLRGIRQKIRASGAELLDWDGIDRERY